MRIPGACVENRGKRSENSPRQNDGELEEDEATAAPRIVVAAEEANEPELEDASAAAAADVSLQAAASTRPPSVARPRRSILLEKKAGSFFSWKKQEASKFFPLFRGGGAKNESEHFVAVSFFLLGLAKREAEKRERQRDARAFIPLASSGCGVAVQPCSSQCSCCSRALRRERSSSSRAWEPGRAEEERQQQAIAPPMPPPLRPLLLCPGTRSTTARTRCSISTRRRP